MSPSHTSLEQAFRRSWAVLQEVLNAPGSPILPPHHLSTRLALMTQDGAPASQNPPQERGTSQLACRKDSWSMVP